MKKSLVLLNPAAHQWCAREHLRQIHHRLDSIGATVVEGTGIAERDCQTLKDALEDGYTCVIAAGGDGTVHSVVNALWRIGGGAIPKGVYFGAIGLGSSNDFHKPCGNDIPIRIRTETATPRDLILCQLCLGGIASEQICVISASIGATARANEFFNSNAGILPHLKKRATTAAIAYAAIHAIRVHQNIPAILEFPDRTLEVDISNLSILKTSYLSGSLHFDLRIEPDSGQFGVALSHGLSRFRLFTTLLALYRGKFGGRPGSQSCHVNKVRFETDKAVALEIDGEVSRATSATFVVQPGAIMTCGA